MRTISMYESTSSPCLYPELPQYFPMGNQSRQKEFVAPMFCHIADISIGQQFAFYPL